MNRISITADRAIASSWIPLLCTLFVFLVPVSIVIWGIPAAGNLVASHMPMVWEHKLGRYVLNVVDMQTEPTKLSSAKQVIYENRIKKLANLAGLPSLEIYFRHAPPNAFAIPGNIIVITDGLIDLMDDAEVVDAVIAHELGHLQLRHGLQRIVSMNLFSTLVLRMNGQDSTAATTGNVLASLTLFPFFSRENESQADSYAFALLNKNGQSPLLFAKAMIKLSELKNNNKSNEVGYSDSHPPTQQRIKVAEAAAMNIKD